MAIPSIFIGAAAKATDWSTVFSDYTEEHELNYTMKILVRNLIYLDEFPVIFNLDTVSSKNINLGFILPE